MRLAKSTYVRLILLGPAGVEITQDNPAALRETLHLAREAVWKLEYVQVVS